MKKFIATVCFVGLAAGLSAGLSACSTDGQGYVDQAPYAEGRTAGSEAERVFRETQRK